MRKLLATAFAAALFAATAFISIPRFAAQPDRNYRPLISGTTQGNTGCAVLEKHKPLKGPLLALGVIYLRTQYVVLDTFNCKLPKQKYTGPNDVKELNRTATQEKIKLVVIPAHYTDDELRNAKNICRESAPSQSEVSPTPAQRPATLR